MALFLLSVSLLNGKKALECINVDCGPDAGCNAAPGRGYVCLCDYHGTVKKKLGKPCQLPEGELFYA
jgi:hypothetical protein